MEEKYKGWFEGFGNVISEKLGKNILDEILDNCEKCEKVSNDSEMAMCVKDVIDRFDDTVKDEDKRHIVMETLGNHCVQNVLPAAKEVKEKSGNIEEIVKNLNEKFGAELFKLEGNKIHSTLNRCFCHWGVKETEVPISITYCHCSLGWMKTLFKTLLDKPVEVDLIQSVITGSDSCKFVIHLD